MNGDEYEGDYGQKYIMPCAAGNDTFSTEVKKRIASCRVKHGFLDISRFGVNSQRFPDGNLVSISLGQPLDCHPNSLFAIWQFG